MEMDRQTDAVMNTRKRSRLDFSGAVKSVIQGLA